MEFPKKEYYHRISSEGNEHRPHGTYRSDEEHESIWMTHRRVSDYHMGLNRAPEPCDYSFIDVTLVRDNLVEPTGRSTESETDRDAYRYTL